MCKPCHRSRACHHVDCPWYNESDEPILCVACESREKNPHAAGRRCAVACPTHTTAAERDLQLCSACFTSRLPCSHCSEPIPASSMTRVQCAKEHCSVAVALCNACSGMHTGHSKLTCGPCWIQDGRLCLYCERTPAQRNKKFDEHATRALRHARAMSVTHCLRARWRLRSAACATTWLCGAPIIPPLSSGRLGCVGRTGTLPSAHSVTELSILSLSSRWRCQLHRARRRPVRDA